MYRPPPASLFLSRDKAGVKAGYGRRIPQGPIGMGKKKIIAGKFHE
jgi:hypothetical protein